MSRTRYDYAQWLGEQLACHPEAVDAACELAAVYGPPEVRPEVVQKIAAVSGPPSRGNRPDHSREADR